MGDSTATGRGKENRLNQRQICKEAGSHLKLLPRGTAVLSVQLESGIKEGTGSRYRAKENGSIMFENGA